MSIQTNEVFYTDKQLRDRWHCSHMKLWRMRQAGILKPPVKLGGKGVNLTPATEVLRVEAPHASAA